VISLDVDFTKKTTVKQKADGSIWLAYFDTKGQYHEVPITVVGLSDFLRARVPVVAPRASKLSAFMRGSLVFEDDFEVDPIKVSNYWPSGTLAAETTGVNVYEGARSLKLTTTAVINESVAACKCMEHLRTAKNHALETMFRFPLQTNFQFEIGMRSYGMPENIRAVSRLRLTITPTDQTLTISTPQGDQPIEGNINWMRMTTYCQWNRMKLVIDPLSQKYEYGIFCGRYYDLRNYAILTEAGYLQEYFPQDVSLKTLEAAAKTAYIDNMVATVDEPDER